MPYYQSPALDPTSPSYDRLFAERVAAARAATAQPAPVGADGMIFRRPSPPPSFPEMEMGTETARAVPAAPPAPPTAAAPPSEFESRYGNFTTALNSGMRLPPPPGSAPGLEASVDRSRGLSGEEWARSQPPAPPRLTTADAYNAEDYARIRGLQADLDARYGTDEASAAASFNPRAAQARDFDEQAALEVSRARAQNPLAFMAAQAELPEQAKMNARLRSGRAIFDLMAPFESQLQEIEDLAAALRGRPDAAEHQDVIRGLETRAERLKAHVRLLQQSMGFGYGQTPSALYREDPLGG